MSQPGSGRRPVGVCPADATPSASLPACQRGGVVGRLPPSPQFIYLQQLASSKEGQSASLPQGLGRWPATRLPGVVGVREGPVWPGGQSRGDVDRYLSKWIMYGVRICGKGEGMEGQTMKLKVVTHRAKEGGYWAEVPALPGCYSQGETAE